MLESLCSCSSEGLEIYEKSPPVQLFSCEICEIFKNAYFEERLLLNVVV